MTLMLELAPDLENSLQVRATNNGQEMAACARELLASALRQEQIQPMEPIDDWEAQLLAIGSAGPSIPLEYTRREHIYE